jgi:hypothetical protein
MYDVLYHIYNWKQLKNLSWVVFTCMTIYVQAQHELNCILFFNYKFTLLKININNRTFEECCLLSYNAMDSVEVQCLNILPPSSWLKSKPSYSCLLLAWHTFWPWRWRQYLPPKHLWNSTILHRFTSQKIVLLQVITVRTINTAEDLLDWKPVIGNHPEKPC